MKKQVKVFTGFIFFLSAVYLYAQDESQKFYGKFKTSIRGSATIPHPISNRAFRKSFVGVYGFSLSPSIDLRKGITFGAIYENGLFSVPANKISGLTTTVQYNNAGLRLGYDHYYSNKMLLSISLDAGQTWVNAKSLNYTVTDTAAHSFISEYIKPELNLFFFIEDNFSIGINLSYHIINKSFDPAMPGLTSYRTFDSSDLGGAMGYLNWGFGFYVGLWKRK